MEAMADSFDFYERNTQEGGGLRTEWKKWKSMSGSARLQYLYDNYLAQLIVGAVLAAVIAMAVTALIQKNRPQPYLTIGLLDYDGWREILEQDKTSDAPVSVVAWQGVDYQALESGGVHNTVLGITAMIAAGDLDGMLAGPQSLLFLQKEKDDYFWNLEEIFTEEELEVLSERLLYAYDPAAGEYPLAIEVTDAAVFRENPLYEGKVYLAVAVNSSRTEHMKEWLDYLYDDGGLVGMWRKTDGSKNGT